jgi:predicted nucleic acid-binding protein
MKVVLDTNVYSALMKGHMGVAERVRQAERVFFSAIVVGELLFGFRAGTRYERNLAELESFLSHPLVEFLQVSKITADRFGRIASSLRKKGKPIPTNDIWIAAHAMEYGADMMSFDEHFEAIDGLALVRP